jgi:hypothetical protein
MADPLFLVTMGDSIIRGVWADSFVGKPGTRFYSSIARAGLSRTVNGIFNNYDKIKDPYKRAKYNDETMGFTSRDHLSGYQGNQDYSIPTRLMDYFQREVKVKNFALLAGNYPEAMAQIRDLEEFMENNKFHRRPDILIVSFNAMTFLRKYTIESYRVGVERFFKALTANNPNSTIIVTQPLDMVSILTVEDEVTVPPVIKCSDINRLMDNIGSLHGLKAGYEGPNIDTARIYLDTLIDIVEKEVSQIENALLITNLRPPNDEWHKYLATDCLHPNVKGQSLFAEKMWNQLISSGVLDSL